MSGRVGRSHVGALIRLVARPFVVVGAAVAFDCWTLRAERTPVAYPSDTSVHTAMVQFAASRISSGHLPWTSWFPYIGLGSAQFLHYQSLASVLAGLASPLISPGAAVAWSTYLLLGLWPICVYFSARMFSMSPWASAGAACASPFLSSIFMSGYEQRAYIFLGYGLWTQLFGMWCLPVAWGLTWRSISKGRLHLAAAIAVGLTICLHFETGYLALLPLFVWPWLVRDALRRRITSALRIGAGALLVSAWAWIPLLAQRKWSAINSVLAGTQYQKGYGATTMLRWLVEGRIFDSGSVMPTLTLLGAVGLFVSIARWRRSPADRAILTIAVCSFVLECGLTTFGVLADIVPGHQDIYFRRFAIGLQLAWLLLVGNGLVALARAVSRLVRAQVSRAQAAPRWPTTSAGLLSGIDGNVGAVNPGALTAGPLPLGAELSGVVTASTMREQPVTASGSLLDATPGASPAQGMPAPVAGPLPSLPSPAQPAVAQEADVAAGEEVRAAAYSPDRGNSPDRAYRRPGLLEMLGRWAVAVMILAALASGLGAVIARVTSLDSENGNTIAFQAAADRIQGPAVNHLVGIMRSLGPGRVYAGNVLNWGTQFKVGVVPVFKYLETQKVDVMVYSATTTTLMDDPEYYFDERSPGDYALFGIRYLLLPDTMRPLVPAKWIATRQIYSLWQVDGVGYARVVETVGSLEMNRADIGPKSRDYMDSPLPALGLYLTVRYEGSRAAPPTAPDPAAMKIATTKPVTTSSRANKGKSAATPSPATPASSLTAPSQAGTIVSETDDLASGAVHLEVDLQRRAVVALSVTYDPGWTALVDGHRAPTEMLAPALLGVTVGRGTHSVEFTYVGYPDYGPLFALAASVLVLAFLWMTMLALRRRRRRARLTDL